MTTTPDLSLHVWTVEEFDRAVAAGVFATDARIELINGQLIEDDVTQSPRHARTIQYLTAAFAARLMTRQSPRSLRVQLPLACGRAHEPEPDLAVVVGGPDEYRDHHPTVATLVIEVSDRSLAFDLDDKAAVYASAGIPVYWVIDLPHDVVHVLSDPDRLEGRYTRLARYLPGGTIDGLRVSGILGIDERR